MDKLWEYLQSKGKIEWVIAIIFFVFLPEYLICFLYYPEWFCSTEIIKITALNAGVLSAVYTLEVFIYIVTNMFTKKGRSIEEILEVPLIVLGIMMLFIIIARLFCKSLLFSFFIVLVISIFINIFIFIIREKSIKMWKKYEF